MSLCTRLGSRIGPRAIALLLTPNLHARARRWCHAGRGDSIGSARDAGPIPRMWSPGRTQVVHRSYPGRTQVVHRSYSVCCTSCLSSVCSAGFPRPQYCNSAITFASEVMVRDERNSPPPPPPPAMGAAAVKVRVSGRPGRMNTPLSLQLPAPGTSTRT